MGGGPWKCPVPACGNLSDLSYRCDECGKLFEGNEEEAVGRSTSVGG